MIGTDQDDGYKEFVSDNEVDGHNTEILKTLNWFKNYNFLFPTIDFGYFILN